MAASTLADVSRLAGVSLATASRVLNGSTRKPGKEIVDRVRAAAETLGYLPNAQAQALARSSTGLIGLVVHDIADPYFSAIARGVQSAAQGSSRMVLLATTDGTPEQEKAAVVAFASRRADAIVIAGSRSVGRADLVANEGLAAELTQYLRNGGRVSMIGQPLRPEPTGGLLRTIEIPNEQLAQQLAERMAENRPGPFIVVSGPAGLLTSEQRLAGFQRGLGQAGRAAAEVIHTSFSRDGGYQAGLEISRRIAASSGPQKPPPMIFATNDLMAIGVAAALRQRGLRIPADAGLAGFDDIEWLKDFQPALTTVRLPLEQLGAQAVAAAFSATESDYQVAGTVEIRESTSPEPSG